MKINKAKKLVKILKQLELNLTKKRVGKISHQFDSILQNGLIGYEEMEIRRARKRIENDEILKAKEMIRVVVERGYIISKDFKVKERKIDINNL